MIRGLPAVACTVLCLLACGCTAASGDNAPGEQSNRSADWTEATHGNDASPDYAVVFPDDAVNVIEIDIPPENWQKMLDEMTTEFGEFGGPSGGAMNGNPQGSLDFDPSYVSADVLFDNMTWTDVGVRFKGQSTLGRTWQSGSYKISLKLDFDQYEDENPDIKNQRFYGFDELSLKSGFGDNSLLRDKIVPDIFNDAGVVAPATAFYRVYIDYGEGPVYFGLYTMIESVEDTLIETRFEDDSGNLYKPEGTGATFAEGTFDIAAFEKKTNEDEEDWSDVEALYTVLNSGTRKTDPAAWREELESVFNVDGFIRWLAVNTAIQNWDTYGIQSRNFYLYADPADGRLTWIPWDNNEALSEGRNEMAFDRVLPGNGTIDSRRDMPQFVNKTGWNGMGAPGAPPASGNGAGWNDTNIQDMPGGGRPTNNGEIPAFMDVGGRMGNPLSMGLTEVGDTWPLIRYLMDDPVYSAIYRENLHDVVTTAFAPSKMQETYQYYHELIEPYVTGAEGEQEGYTNLNSPETFDSSLQQLGEHVESRYDACLAFLAGEEVS